MNPIETILAAQGMLVLDGAMATQLEARGCDIADELWSAKILLEAPQQIAAVHQDYFAAGADCAITASYQATIPGFLRRGLSREQAVRLLQDAVRLAAEARDAFWALPENRQNRCRPLVAASVGPYGAYLADGSEYRGNYGLDRAQLLDFHRERMALLAQAGADLFACETIPSLEEGLAVARLAEENGLCCWVSFSCRSGGEICDGTPIEDCARALEDCPAVAAVGVNCTAPEYVRELVERICRVTGKPIVVYPNSGECYDPVTKTWHGPADGRSFASRAADWYEAGARIIGGCCRTTPRDIAELSRQLRGQR